MYSRSQYLDWYKISLGLDAKTNNGLAIEIRENTLGQYDVFTFEIIAQKPSFRNWFKARVKKELHKETFKTRLDAINWADVHIFRNYRDKVGMISQSAGWRKDSPSEKQIALLKKFWYVQADQLSKWEACNLLSKHFADKASKRFKK